MHKTNTTTNAARDAGQIEIGDKLIVDRSCNHNTPKCGQNYEVEVMALDNGAGQIWVTGPGNLTPRWIFRSYIVKNATCE